MALGTEGLYWFSQVNVNYNGAVLPLFTPLRCSSSFLEKNLQVRICARLVFAFLEEQPNRELVSCGWEDMEICLEGNNLREFDQAEYGLGVTVYLNFPGQAGAGGLYFSMDPKLPALNLSKILLLPYGGENLTYGAMPNS